MSHDAAWCALEPPLEDAHDFVDGLIEALQDTWDVTPICSTQGTETIRAVLLPLVASYIFHALLPIYRLQTDNHVAEQILLDLMESVILEDLEVPQELLLPEDSNPYGLPISTLNEINNQNNPVQMMNIISQTTVQIYQCVEDYWGHPAQSDEQDMIRVFLYVLLRANVPDMLALIQYIEDFTLIETRSSEEHVEFGIIMFKSAIRWCQVLDEPQEDVHMVHSYIDEELQQQEEEEVQQYQQDSDNNATETTEKQEID